MFSRDVTVVMFLSVNKGTAAMLVSPTNRAEIELTLMQMLSFVLVENMLIDYSYNYNLKLIRRKYLYKYIQMHHSNNNKYIQMHHTNNNNLTATLPFLTIFGNSFIQGQ